MAFVRFKSKWQQEEEKKMCHKVMQQKLLALFESLCAVRIKFWIFSEKKVQISKDEKKFVKHEEKKFIQVMKNLTFSWKTLITLLQNFDLISNTLFY